MRNYSALLAILGLTFSLSATATPSGGAGGHEGQQPPTFEEFDENGDGQLSLEELKGPLANDFEKLDADGDGFLSEEEMPKGPPERK